MQIVKKSRDGIQSLPLDAILLMQRRVFLTESITAESANEILKQLLYLESEDSETPIRLIIDSPGGEVVSGLKIIDQMQGMETPIETCCVGTAASMAAFIDVAGKSAGADEELIGILSRDTGRDVHMIEKIITSEPVYLNAAETVTFGICDTVVKRV